MRGNTYIYIYLALHFSISPNTFDLVSFPTLHPFKNFNMFKKNYEEFILIEFLFTKSILI
jgi:hypothetical protein